MFNDSANGTVHEQRYEINAPPSLVRCSTLSSDGVGGGGGPLGTYGESGVGAGSLPTRCFQVKAFSISLSHLEDCCYARHTIEDVEGQVI